MIRSIIFAGKKKDLYVPTRLATASLVSSFTADGGQAIEDLFVNENGTKHYTVASNSDLIREYNLSTPFALNTRTFVTSITSPNASPTGIFFSPSGTRLFVCDEAARNVRSYTLATPWSLATASLDAASYATGLSTGDPTGVCFSNNGLLMFLSINSGNTVRTIALATPWELSSITGVVRNFSVGVSILQSVAFAKDGGKMYTGSGLFPGRVREYILSTPYDTSTATFTTSLSPSMDYIYGISLAKNDTKLYITDNNTDLYREYNLSP